jgi:hypothetical protein
MDPIKLALVTWFMIHGLQHLGCKKRKKVHLRQVRRRAPAAASPPRPTSAGCLR